MIISRFYSKDFIEKNMADDWTVLLITLNTKVHNGDCSQATKWRRTKLILFTLGFRGIKIIAIGALCHKLT